MKRRQRKTVLDINGESDSPRRRWPQERHPHNGSPNNPLANFLGQYNSDSEAEDDSKPRAHKLNDQVNDFLKEIQSIAPDSNKNNQNTAMPHPGSYWQECYDEQTGYPYYWHTETNQVTWEMPPELKMMHEKNEKESHTSQGSHIPQWSNVPSNKFSQSPSNIPEGMIPKEVVVRNRNRQAGIMNKPAKPPAKPDHSKSPGFKKDDSSDDGKIEMITSFGNEDSESEESEHEHSPKKLSLPKKSSLKPMKPPAPLLSSNNKSSESNDSKVPVGPALPSLHYGPQNKEKLSEKLSQNLQSTRSASHSSNEEDIIKRLKNQAKLLQFREGSSSSKSENNSENAQKSSKDLKLSLVPGYEDDSDGDEDAGSAGRKQPVKPLFPISESASNDSNSNDKIAKKIESGAGNIRIYEYKNSESASVEDKLEEESNSNDNNDEREDPKTEQEAKANKFLESIDAPTKAFQRKRRIAFDVAPNKGKTSDLSTKDESPSGAYNVGLSTEVDEHRGLGFSKDDVAAGSPNADSNKSEGETTSKRPLVSFVKASKAEEERSSSPKGISKPKEVSEADKVEMRALTEPIMEKLRFLSEGSPAASAVQVMAIQIQTLLCAWEAGELNDSYLRNWLVGTGCELTRLEQTAAPPGWECQWDRSHKRYYYRNTTTGEAQWTYPQTDIVGGTEEMELCTTPPPPEHVEAPIIEMSAQAATMSSKDSSVKEADKHSAGSGATLAAPSLPIGEPTVPPPPPPDISSPCTPPPPRISDDIRRNRKRRQSPDAGETKEDSKESKPVGAEPLPPGVDPPEIAYSLPASALEAGVLYGAQQTNPIYAATLAGAAGIPLLPHHHTAALMQGQLMHYSPAYHQHLHNQALVAARLSGQEAVQFMVAAEYARVYENNQVIAKPPIKMPHESSLGSAINSFYSDIASIEKSSAELEKEKAEMRLAESTPSPIPQVPSTEAEAAAAEAMREKKKKKLKTGIGKKQKEMSSMVAKWQRAQKNYKEGH